MRPQTAILSLLLSFLLFPVSGHAGGARQAASVRLVPSPGLPFSVPDLQDAVLARLPISDLSDIVASVEVAANDRVLVRVHDKARTVVLAGSRGTAAARLVALAIADLVMVESAPLPAPALVSAPSIASALPTRTEAYRPAPLPARTVSLALLSRAASDGDGRSRWSLSLEASAPLSRTWHLAGSLGYRAGSSGTAQAIDVALRGIPVRASLGANLGRFEVRADALAHIYFASGGRGDQGVLPGAGLSLRYKVPVSGAWRLVAAAGVDLFAWQLDFRVGGQSALMTERATGWLGLGIAWEVAR